MLVGLFKCDWDAVSTDFFVGSRVVDSRFPGREEVAAPCGLHRLVNLEDS